MTLPVAILAGGLATRLGPVSERIPKSLVEVAGRPFAEHQIELLRAHGFADIVFVVGHLGKRVRDHLGDGAKWDVAIRYVFDGERLLGTGGALRRALPELGDAFFVLYGDSYLECDYGAVERTFQASGKTGMMTVFRNDDRWDRSNVQFADGRIVRYDKQDRTSEMRHIDYGLGILRHAAFEGRPDGEPFDLVAIYQRLIAIDELAGFEVADRFFEVGSPAGIEETSAHLMRKGRSNPGVL